MIQFESVIIWYSTEVNFLKCGHDLIFLDNDVSPVTLAVTALDTIDHCTIHSLINVTIDRLDKKFFKKGTIDFLAWCYLKTFDLQVPFKSQDDVKQFGGAKINNFSLLLDFQAECPKSIKSHNEKHIKWILWKLFLHLIINQHEWLLHCVVVLPGILS